jgi:hypothetical protein
MTEEEYASLFSKPHSPKEMPPLGPTPNLQQINSVPLSARFDPLKGGILPGKNGNGVHHGFGATILPFDFDMSPRSSAGIPPSGSGSAPDQMKLASSRIGRDEIFSIGLELGGHFTGFELEDGFFLGIGRGACGEDGAVTASEDGEEFLGIAHG